jgi:branched-chain amino acid transport system ATP-binding protein
VAGEDLTELDPPGRAERGLGRMFQDARLFPSLTVAETLAVALERHVEVREPVAVPCGSAPWSTPRLPWPNGSTS